MAMGSYIQHLAIIRKKTNIIATQDICNAQGQLLVPKGAVLDDNATDRIVKFKLMRPIEHCVTIENELRAECLVKKVNAFIAQDPYLMALCKIANCAKELEACCAVYDRFPILRQKITVMSIRLERQFDQALFCAWNSIWLARSYSSDDHFISSAFIACLAHDIGLLHLNPEIFAEQGRLSLESIKQVHVHPVIGHKILAGIKEIPELVAEGIKEHHENIDGTGFPSGKVGKNLSELGRMINLLDSVWGIYSKSVLPLGRPLRDVAPILAMNYYAYSNPFYNLFVSFIKKDVDDYNYRVDASGVDEVIHKARQGHEYIHRFLENKKTIIVGFGHSHGNAQLFSIQNSYIQIYSFMAESGLLNDAYMRWLKQVQAEKIESAYSEAEEAYLMVREVVFQIQRIKNQAKIFFQNPRNAKFLALFPDIVERINVNDVPFT